MKAYEFLSRYRIAQDKADRLRERYNELVKYDSVGSMRCGFSGRGSGISKPTERKVEKAQSAREMWKEAETHAIEIRQEVFDLIYDLPGKLGDVMYYRYILLRKWADICEATELSNTQAHKINNEGLTLVQDALDKRDGIASDCDPA